MEEMQMENTQAESTKIEGRNAVLEAFRSGKTIDKLFVLDGCKDGPIQTILREAKKHDTLVQFVAKERLEQLSETKKHQGVIAMAAAFSYATVEDILENARKKNEAPFVILLDNIEDPHNLGALRWAAPCWSGPAPTPPDRITTRILRSTVGRTIPTILLPVPSGASA